MYARLINRFSATRAGSWLVKHVASKLDPVVFRMTRGRWISVGTPTLPMLLLTTTGRRSGLGRHTQLAYHRDGDSYLVVASAMGQARHPDWSYNLEANPRVEVLVRGERFRAHAEPLADDEKARHWSAITRTIPQMRVYERRTDRNIKVFRLCRSENDAGADGGSANCAPPAA
jgi:deazaflavin-dependent oxidoreductase (nitroreductase family)